MREKYESLAVAVLRDLAKSRGIQGISAMKKADLIEAMLALDEEENKKKSEEKQEEKPAEKQQEKPAEKVEKNNPEDTLSSLDSGITANGILEVMADGYGFIRCANYLPGENDVYVSPSQIRKFNLKTGDIVCGNTRIKTQQEKFSALLYVSSVNGFHPSVAQARKNFNDLTPIFPNERVRLEYPGCSVAMRIVDLVSPIGKGQRGMIVSQPKAGKTTLLK
ncbi:MAG: Rho termination factor N-terminal domain-containing protein, partial [Lachnospiraceae bacterium]|nr:Rho termination factor N-terminal domain-containing protein [Lachnospiraceae bacterium]